VFSGSHVLHQKKKSIRVFEIRFFTKLLDTKFGGQKCMCIGLGQSLEISHKKWLKSGSGPCGIDASGLHLLTNRIFSPLCEEVIKAFRKAFPCAEFKMGRMTVSASLYQAGRRDKCEIFREVCLQLCDEGRMTSEHSASHCATVFEFRVFFQKRFSNPSFYKLVFSKLWS
jgi:hypothetical protein